MENVKFRISQEFAKAGKLAKLYFYATESKIYE